ncbi:MAG: 50S ribosomal protein L18 [Patescibacteria group bacterium]
MKKTLRVKRHLKIRKRIVGTSGRFRLSVFRSNRHIYAQIIDDTTGKTLVWASDVKVTGKKSEKSYNVGKTLGHKAIKKNITKVVFDRGGFLYHGRISELAKGAREGGLEF